MLRKVSEYRVAYADTDKMGFVYYGNYLALFERARTELMRQHGLTYRELEADGYILSVAGKGSFVAQVDQLAEQQKKQAADAFRAAAQKLRQLGLTQAQLAQLLTEEEPTP